MTGLAPIACRHNHGTNSQGECLVCGCLVPPVTGSSYPGLKFNSYAHAWATGIIGAALMDAESFTTHIRSDQPYISIKVGAHRFGIIIEELQ